MDFTSVPIIVVCCYIIGEIYKVLFKNKQEAYKLIPIVMAIIGGLLGIIIYLTNPEMILNAENIWIALGIGIVSGASSTGANQIIKQIFKKGEEKGMFLFGGSTIVLLVKKDAVVIDRDILNNSVRNIETRVKCGEKIGVCKE